ncbi:MFS transporter [Actinomadura roseirufa]|uniref:MFS transporter n=1 Tax=Actinomadura roseirufa TaxID=2094049 RepID=UPI0010412859|nr:MFS transporter [Actinomadura roseirufa]
MRDGTAAGRAAIFAGTFAALLNMSVVTVALPRTASGLGADPAFLRWVVDAYTLCLSALMLSGGALGDRYGRRRVWLWAVALLGCGSVVCATAPSAEVLVAGRVVQGAAAAVIVPGAMSLIAQARPEPAGRARMIGWWSTVASLSVGLGPLLGGVLVDVAGWRSVFWIDVPVCLAVLVLGASGLAESRDPAHAALDLPGQVLGVVWLGSLSYGLIEGGRLGWTSAAPATALVVAVAALAAFVAVELRARRPMLPIRLLRDGRFAAANGAALLLGLGAYGIFFHLSPYFQEVRHGSATGAGLRMLPMALGMSPLGAVAGRLTARHGPYGPMAGAFGPYGPMAGAFALIAASLLAMAAVLGVGTPYAVPAVPLLCLGAGIGVVLPPLNASALAAVPRERSGAAAATVNAVRQTGTALGIAGQGAILAARGGGGAGGAGFTSGLRVVAAAAGAISVAAMIMVLVLRRAAAPGPGGAPAEDVALEFRPMEN